MASGPSVILARRNEGSASQGRLLEMMGASKSRRGNGRLPVYQVMSHPLQQLHDIERTSTDELLLRGGMGVKLGKYGCVVGACGRMGGV